MQFATLSYICYFVKANNAFFLQELVLYNVVYLSLLHILASGFFVFLLRMLHLTQNATAKEEGCVCVHLCYGVFMCPSPNHDVR